MSFQIGDRVRWLKDTSESSGTAGVVVNILPDDQDDLYDVKFDDFGLRTLHGYELRLMLARISSCHEKECLFVSHKKALDIYMRGVHELVTSVGSMAHADFEFLSQIVRTARRAAIEAREQLNKHTAEHGC